MRLPLRLLATLAFFAAASGLSAQDAGPVATLMAKGANPDGPFATRQMAATDSLVQRAREQLGRRYRFAAASPERGFDCSGLVKYVLGAFGVDLPHNAARIAREGEAISTDTTDLRPGDLLMFGRGRGQNVSHVGIYVGDGKMIHASTSQHRVVEVKVPSKSSTLKLRSIRRVLRDSTTTKSGSE